MKSKIWKILTLMQFFLLMTTIVKAVAIQPNCCSVINAHNNQMFPSVISIPERHTSIIILEYKADGTIEKSIIKMRQEQYRRFQAEWLDAKGLDARLSILKKYNLIPSNVTVEKLRAGMEEKVQKLGLDKEQLEQLASNDFIQNNEKNNDPGFTFISGYDTFCYVEMYGSKGIMIPIGFSLVSLLLSLFFSDDLSLDIFSFDIMDRFFSKDLEVITYDNLSSHDPNVNAQVLWGTGKFVGFVGFMVFGDYHFPFFANGVTAYVKVFGMKDTD